MSAQHTPGPWAVCEDGSDFYVEPRNDPSLGICTVMSIDAQDGKGAYTRGATTRANARLIATSPDLLKAVELAVIFADRRGGMPTKGQWQVLERNFRAAFAKATGSIAPGTCAECDRKIVGGVVNCPRGRACWVGRQLETGIAA